MRNALISLCVLLCSVAPAAAQVSVGIGFPGVSIGINVPLYPELVPVPGYPVYYAPGLSSNYFFYDGMYWVYQADNWYASSWYNGPWDLVAPEDVPVFVLRVPVRYYLQPPQFFIGWRSDESPRWGEHWGSPWNQRRSGWDHWNRSAVPAPAPLPVYQRQYSGDRYPRAGQQQALRSQNYRYEPHDPVVRQQIDAPRTRSAPASAERGSQVIPQARSPGPQGAQNANQPPVVQQSAPTQRGQQGAPQEKNPGPQGTQRTNQPPLVQQSTPAAPRAQAPQSGNENVQRAAVSQAPSQTRSPPAQQQPQKEVAQRQQTARAPQREETGSQGREAPQEQKRGPEPGQERSRDKPDDRGR
jgi:hypothetical protein